MMLKIICLALGHRFRVVQEFTPLVRRVKCVRCGGDWGMNDHLRMMIPWTPELEQAARNIDGEILEPLPAWRSLPAELLTWSELARATLWPGAIAMTVSGIVGHTLILAAGMYVGVLVGCAVSWAIARLLAQRAIERAYERKCNSLEA